jgi:hypothetical protein
MDDFNSMYNGLMGQKGRVHLNFGDEITPDILRSIDGDIPRNEKIKRLAEIIDGFIYENYKLWPNNYIATDIINNNTQFASEYTENEREKFVETMKEKLSELEGDYKQFEDIYLKMFAYPVKNANKKSEKYIFNF